MSRAIRAYREDQGRLADAQRSGRSRVTTEEEDQLIVAAVVADPFLSAKEIREALRLDASAKTIRRRLQVAGVRSCVAAQKPHLTDKQRQARLDFARAVEQWSAKIGARSSLPMSPPSAPAGISSDVSGDPWIAGTNAYSHRYNAEFTSINNYFPDVLAVIIPYSWRNICILHYVGCKRETGIKYGHKNTTGA